MNSGNVINVITLHYIAKLDYVIEETSVGVQKIDSLALKIYSMLLARFLP